MNKVVKILFLIICLCWNQRLDAQYLKLFPSIKMNYKNAFSDSLSVTKELNKLKQNVISSGYILADYDSVIYNKDTITAYLFRGEKYKFNKIFLSEKSKLSLLKFGVNYNNLFNTDFSIKNTYKFYNRIINFSENNGFPFVKVYFDSVQFEGKYVNARLNYIPESYITFDSVVVTGNSKIKYKYLCSYIGINQNQPFSEKKFNDVSNYLRQLSYIKLKKQPEIYFEKNNAHVLLDLESRKSGQFDFILGVLPNENNGKVLITGEASLRQRNLFNSGKTLTVDWKRFQQSSQFVDLGYTHTRLFGSALDAGFIFNFLKQDTLFSQIKRGISFGALLNSKFRLTFFAEINSTRLDQRTSNSEAYQNATNLPILADVNINKYGLELNWNNTDDFFYPKKGNQLFLKTSIGNKSIIINQALNPILYEDLDLKNLQFDYKIIASKYIKTGTKSTILTRVQTSQVYNQNLFLSDLNRVGGLQTIRGFNEQFFFTSFYAISTLEYRFFTDETSYLFLFYDQAYINSDILNTYSEDYPSGVGAGISFTTPSGIFNFAYSVGRTNIQPFSLNYSKLHFGFVSRF